MLSSITCTCSCLVDFMLTIPASSADADLDSVKAATKKASATVSGLPCKTCSALLLENTGFVICARAITLCITADNDS